jgi:hypothetical protein
VAVSSDLLTLPFDQFQRYAAVVEVADSLRAYLSQPQLNVLDVGGFHRTRDCQARLPLVQFLPSDLTVATDLAESVLPNYVRASGAVLPFGSEVFELVVSCDTLEHVPPSSRSAFVHELLRVASHCVVLIFPFESEHNQRAERILRDYLAGYDCTHGPLEEHFELGLPTVGDLRTMMGERGLAAVEFADGYLPNWLAMMMVQLTPETSLAFLAQLNRFYNRHFSADDRREPAYRRVFVIAKPGHEELLPTVSRAAGSRPEAGFPRPDFAPDLGCVLEQAQSDEHKRLDSLRIENARLLRMLEGYEQGRFIRFMRWLHSWRNRPTGRPDAH